VTDTGFEIDGKSYEVALPSTFDMDEAQIFYEYTGFVVEEIWLGGGEDLTRRPGFLAALAHISFRRGNETAENDEIRMVVGKQNRLELFGSLLEAVQPEPVVSEDPKEPSPDTTNSSATLSETASSQNGTEKEPDSSGKSSAPSSVPQVVALGTTGISESDGDHTSDHLRPVA